MLRAQLSDDLRARLTDALPDGIDVTVVVERPDSDESLQEAVTSCTWELWSDELTPADIESSRSRCSTPID